MPKLNEMKRLAELRAATDAILDALKAERNKIGDAVNWADLKCNSARHVVCDDGDAFYQVIIDEAAPGATELQHRVAERLGADFGHVEVITEW